MVLWLATVTVLGLVQSPWQDPPLVGESRAAPPAWAAVVGQSLWVCWDRGEPPRAECWQKIEGLGALALESTPDPLALAFVDAQTLAVGTVDEGVLWLVIRGSDRPTPLEPGQEHDAVILDVPRRRWCSDGGWLPVHDGKHWAWRSRSCDRTQTCLEAPVPWARIRIQPPVAVRVVVELTRGVQRAEGMTIDTRVLFAVRLSFGPFARRQSGQHWPLVQSLRRRIIPLPPIPDGPLADRERAAIRTLLCGASA